MLFRHVAVFLVLATIMPAACLAEFRVGVAIETITPDPLLPISGGMGPSAPAKEKRGELSVRALVLANDDTLVAIVSVDVLGFPSVLGSRVKKLIEGIPPENILFAASHTHSAPDCYAFPNAQGGHTGNLDYMQFVCDQMVKAIRSAKSKLQPAHLRIGTGEVQGKVAYNYYAPDLYDRRASVIQAIAKSNKQPIVTLVNYAVHPEVLGANVGICSPDLVGPMRDHIEGEVGGVAMFINGAQGGMVTADNRELDKPSDAQRGYWKDSRTWEECIRIGTTLGKESLRIVADAAMQEQPKLRCLTSQTKFSVDSDELWAVVQYSPLKYPHGDDRTITSQINLVELGNARIVTIPGEALPNIGFYLKRKMGGKHNLLFGLTNDAFGYILTKEDFNSFDRYKYVSSVSLGEQTSQVLIDSVLDLVKQAD